MAIIITIEGADGVGKSTALDELVKAMKDKYPNHKDRIYRHDFPSHGQTSGYLVDEYLAGRILTGNSPTKNAAVYSTYAADRLIWAEDNLDILNDRDAIVIFGRSHLSSLMYQFNTLLGDNMTEYLNSMIDNCMHIYNTEFARSPFKNCRYMNIALTHANLEKIEENAKARVKSEEADIHDKNLELQKNIWQFIEDSSLYFTNANILKHLYEGYDHNDLDPNVLAPFMIKKYVTTYKDDNGVYQFYPIESITHDLMGLIRVGLSQIR